MGRAKTNGHRVEKEIVMAFERSTKNTHLFRAPEGSAIESVYVRREALEEPPEQVTVILRA